MLCLLNNTINKAGPTGPGFVAPWLLFSCVVRCHNEGLCSWLRTGQHGWPLDVHRELILIICMSISPGWKWRRDWLHHHFYLWQVCLNYWHTARTHMHTPQDMPPEVSSQSPSPEQNMGGAQYKIESWLHGTLFHISDARSNWCTQYKNTPYWTEGTVKQHKHRHRHMHTHTW